MNIWKYVSLSLVSSAYIAGIPSQAGSFIFAGDDNGINVITHPIGYNGTGGTLNLGVCIDSTSANASEMVASVRNIVETFNQNQSIINNLYFGSDNNIPGSFFDFESTALHELGHCIGLGHPNAATESGLSGANRDYTKTTDGANNVFNIAPGVDTIIGSLDDVRGDDDNLHWFKDADNNPCATYSGTIDGTTFSRTLGDLPGGNLFAANADRTVCSNLGVANTEAVMQQGTFNDEDQRALVQDDISTLALAKSGLDETAGTADDYTIQLTSHGIVTNPTPGGSPDCDIIIDFDNNETGFAVCKVGGTFLPGGHVAITSANFFFNNSFNWYFNDDICSHGPKTTGTDINLSAGTTNDAQRYRASNTIIGTNHTIESGACLNFSAATKIHIGPNFMVENGAKFRAEVE